MAKAGDKKLVIILIILFAVAFGVIAALCYYRWDGNKKLKEQIESVKKKIEKEEKRKELIQHLQQQRLRRIEAVSQLTKILPTETEASHSVFLRLLSDFAQKAGVVVKSLLPPAEVPDKELRIKKYTYSILVDGTFPDFVRFLNQIEGHTRFLRVDSFELANASVGAGYWPETTEKKIRLQITTYTYNPD